MREKVLFCQFSIDRYTITTCKHVYYWHSPAGAVVASSVPKIKTYHFKAAVTMLIALTLRLCLYSRTIIASALCYNYNISPKMG